MSDSRSSAIRERINDMRDNQGLGAVIKEALIILLGELIISLATVGVYLLIQKFDYTVVTGLALGSAVTVANFMILAITINHAINKFMDKRGDKEMTEEEADAFAKQNQMSVQAAASGTYIVRTLLMLGTLVGAFLLGDYFDVIATVIPLLGYRPIILVSEMIRARLAKKKEVQ